MPSSETHRASTVRRTRRYDLDALRIFAFTLLIFYHVGMFYVSWDWHVKSRFASTAIEPLMRLVNPWRLALLFIISGIAVRHMAERMEPLAFVKRRLLRLGLPLLFGILVIVPPQTFFQLLETGQIETGDTLRFYFDYISFEQKFSVITPTWNHLWYVVYLLAYSLIIAPAMPWLRNHAQILDGAVRLLTAYRGMGILVLPALPSLAYSLVLDPYFPTTHALVDDWANHAHRFTAFLLGFLVAHSERFWGSVHRYRGYAWSLSLGLAFALTAVRLEPAWIAGIREHPGLLRTYLLVDGWFAWLSILSLFAFAQSRWNHPSPALRYLTEAVYPYYILHQTLTIVAGFFLTRLEIHPAWEVIGVVFATIVGCMVIHEYAVRRISWLRPLFGLRPLGLTPSTAR